MDVNASLISAFVSLFIAGFSAAMFTVIKFNDLAHLGKALEEIKKELCEVRNKAIEVSERVSKVEGILATKGKKK
jgi:hypothetical protein